MYTRLSEDNKAKLRSKYEKLQEYKVAYSAINVVSEVFNELSPEEIWAEALAIVQEISLADYRQWKVDKVFSQLKRKYSIFKEEDGTIEKRTLQQQKITTTMVLFDVVMMLALAQKVEPQKAEEHQYFTYMRTILGYIGQTRLFEAMLAVTMNAEEDVEEITGKELIPTDYMEGSPEPAKKDDAQENKLDNDKVRRAKLKEVRAELEYRLGMQFKGGSQWFYVYKVMAEMNTYSNKNYVQFKKDMNAIGVDLNTNTFTRKYKQIKETPAYPNWKLAAGCKQSTLDEGIKIAQIAFGILYM